VAAAYGADRVIDRSVPECRHNRKGRACLPRRGQEMRSCKEMLDRSVMANMGRCVDTAGYTIPELRTGAVKDVEKFSGPRVVLSHELNAQQDLGQPGLAS
jgi:hypothetical protein